MADFPAEVDVAIVGAGIRRRIDPPAATAGGCDPWARGSYSCALPGRAEDRARLAAPLESPGRRRNLPPLHEDQER
jgi:monoamine oxidase